MSLATSGILAAQRRCAESRPRHQGLAELQWGVRMSEAVGPNPVGRASAGCCHHQLTVLVCVACDRPTTGELTGLPGVPERPMGQGSSKADGSGRPRPPCRSASSPWSPSRGAPRSFPPGSAWRSSRAGPPSWTRTAPGSWCRGAPRHGRPPPRGCGRTPAASPGWRHAGCCGTTGRSGMNRLCPRGAEVATLVSDCSTPYELHLDPDRVRAVRQGSPRERERVRHLCGAGPFCCTDSSY